jgi:DNA-binding XRE family transcriptional regulator
MPRGERPVYNRLEVLRAERGLSRRQLADQLDINHQTVGYIERGDYNPSLELALRDLRASAYEAVVRDDVRKAKRKRDEGSDP